MNNRKWVKITAIILAVLMAGSGLSAGILHFLLTESRIGKAARAYLIKPNSGAAHFAANRHICRLLLQKETVLRRSAATKRIYKS